MNNSNLKPIVLVQDKGSYYRRDDYVQNILLKALSQGITDPKELKKIAGLSKVADVYRSLDKLAIRKEYHEALARSGVSLDFVVDNLKKLVENSKSDVVKLAGLQTFLKSVGLDKYEKQEESGKGWEEAVLAANAADKLEEKKDELIEGEYEVKIPQAPEEEIKRQERERKQGRELYEDKQRITG